MIRTPIWDNNNADLNVVKSLLEEIIKEINRLSDFIDEMDVEEATSTDTDSVVAVASATEETEIISEE